MNTDLITAVLLAPGAIVGVPLLLAHHRAGRHDRAVTAMLARERANRATAPAAGRWAAHPRRRCADRCRDHGSGARHPVPRPPRRLSKLLHRTTIAQFQSTH